MVSLNSSKQNLSKTTQNTYKSKENQRRKLKNYPIKNLEKFQKTKKIQKSAQKVQIWPKLITPNSKAIELAQNGPKPQETEACNFLGKNFETGQQTQ